MADGMGLGGVLCSDVVVSSRRAGVGVKWMRALRGEFEARIRVVKWAGVRVM
jgi:hypothetical protein